MTRLPDHDPRKWEYSEHTGAKHEILTRYLGAWFSILGSATRRNARLIIYDGFAGRGRYNGGEDGSPVLIHDSAVRAVERGVASKITIACTEDEPKNFDCLEGVVDGLSRNAAVEIRCTCETFAEGGARFAAWLAKKRPPIPTFVFVDPFGFAGVPLDLIRALLAIPSTEVLLTFMARDMGRFLTLDDLGPTFDEFFGGPAWKKCTQPGDEERTECLLLRYQDVVRPEIAKFATPFRVYEDAKRQTLYYLVHLTNAPLGMRRMKEAMVKHSPEMTFWPITVRPKDQLTLDVSEEAPYQSLQTHLLERFAGRSLKFEELLNEDYPDGVWVEPNYRAAIKDLEKKEDVPLTIVRGRTTASGRAATGLELRDRVKFGAPSAR